MKYIDDMMNEAVKSLGPEDSKEGKMLSQHRPEIYRCTDIDEMIKLCERLFKENHFKSKWTERFIDDLYEIRNDPNNSTWKDALENAIRYFNSVIPTPRNEFKARERSVGEILEQHRDEITDCTTVDELIKTCRRILHDAAVNGEIDEQGRFVTGFFRGLAKQRMTHNDIEFAQYYITNTILNSQKLNPKIKPRYDESESKPKHTKEEIEEAIEYWEGKLLESEDDQELNDEDDVDDGIDDENRNSFSDLCLETASIMKSNGLYSNKCVREICDNIRDFLMDEYNVQSYELPDVRYIKFPY